MKSDKVLIQDCRDRLSSINLELSHLSSLDGARDPASSWKAAKRALIHIQLLSYDVQQLHERFHRRAAKKAGTR